MNEAAMRDYTRWIMDHLMVYAPREALGSATGAVLPDIAINAVQGRFQTTFACPEKGTSPH